MACSKLVLEFIKQNSKSQKKKKKKSPKFTSQKSPFEKEDQHTVVFDLM